MLKCEVCNVNPLITPEEMETGICNNCSVVLINDAHTEDSELFSFGG